MSVKVKKKLTRMEEKEIQLNKIWLETRIERAQKEIQKLNTKKEYEFYKLPVFRSATLDKQFGLEGLNEYHKGDYFITIPLIIEEFKGLPVNIFRIVPYGDSFCIMNLVTFKYLIIETYFMTDVYQSGNVRLGDEKFTRKVKDTKQLKQLLGFK